MLAEEDDAQSESYTIEGKAAIHSGYNDYRTRGFSFETTYAGDMTAEVMLRENGNINILLKNVSYYNPLFRYDRYIGDILFNDIPLESDGSFFESETDVSFSVGSLAGVDKWEASSCFPVYPAEVSGTFSEDRLLDAKFTFWLSDIGYYGSGEFYHHIHFGKTLPPFEYHRSVATGEYGTIVLPFKPSSVTGIGKLYSIAGKLKNDKGKVYCLVLQEEDVFEAGVPYVFLADESEITAVAPGDAVHVSTPVNLIYEDRYGEGLEYVYKWYGLQGTFDYVSTELVGRWVYDDWIEEEYYESLSCFEIEGNEFRWSAMDSQIEAFHAFGIIDYVPLFEGTIGESNELLYSAYYTTDIHSTERYSDVNGYYDLTGRRLPYNHKGFIIVNGKKIITK